MSTAPVVPAEVVASRPVPDPVREGIVLTGMGQAARERVQKTQKLRRSYELQGGIKPATVLNLSPFVRRLPPGWIKRTIPACPEGKSFSVTTLTDLITYPVYKGNTEMSDKRIKPEYDIKDIKPIEQAMEFQRAYGSDLGFEGVSHGGLVVFEGSEKELNLLRAGKDPDVRVPRYHYEGTDRYIVFDERKLTELIAEAGEQLRNTALAAVHEAQSYYDQGPEARKNIDPRTHHVWADFALKKQYIRSAPVWRHTELPAADRCEKCGEQYVSKTGVCKCGYVREPLLAYKSGEIAADHVRMETLTTEQWAEVKKIQAQRKKARGE